LPLATARGTLRAMRLALAALLVVALSGTGCVIVPAGGHTRSAVSAKKCPPGHVWSDGACHSTGRGHDK
jgi:hypothetical protein